MMQGSSHHSQDLALDALDALDEGSGHDETETTPLKSNTKPKGEDLTAAIDAALTDDDDDDEAGGENDDTLDQELQNEMVDFSLHSDDPNEKSILDEAMNLLNDEESGSLNDSKNKKFSDDATQSSMASFSSVDFTHEVNSDNLEQGEENQQNGRSNGTGNQPMGDPDETVPIQQFENALALIQDLEQQVDTLEAAKHTLQFENEELRQQTATQAKLIASYEKKLAEFPKLMEATIEEQTAVAHHVAKGAAKQSFWNEYMSRQEELSAQEKKRRATATTTSLKQSDFLKNVVERQEVEKSKSLPGNFLQGWKSKWSSRGHGIAGGDHNGEGAASPTSKKGVKVPDGNASHLGIVAKDGTKSTSANDKILNLLT